MVVADLILSSNFNNTSKFLEAPCPKDVTSEYFQKSQFLQEALDRADRQLHKRLSKTSIPSQPDTSIDRSPTTLKEMLQETMASGTEHFGSRANVTKEKIKEQYRAYKSSLDA